MEQDKPHISIVVIGHVDCGKTTVTGHVIYKCLSLPEREKSRIEAQAIEIGKSGFKYSWALQNDIRRSRDDSNADCFKIRKFETPKHKFTIIDVPGHIDFMKNAIHGIFFGDCAILTVAAPTGEFEAGFCKSGQTREHALLAYSLGIKQMIVLINKMDCPVKYSENRYKEIVSEVSQYLRKVGFDTEKIPFIPVSAWNGDNMFERSANMPWYTGPTFVEALDSVQEPKRLINKPLRIPVFDLFKIGGVGYVSVGRVETGVLKPGQLITFAPTGKTVTVKSLEMHLQEIKEAKPGDFVGISIPGISFKDVNRGYMIGLATNEPPCAVASFVAQIIVLNHPTQIKTGYAPVILCHTASVSCRFEEIICKVDRRSGKELEKNPAQIKTGDSAIVRLVPIKPICVETFNDYPPLGRFVIRDMKQTIAVGIIKEIIKSD